MSYETLDYNVTRLTPSNRLKIPLKKLGMDKKHPIPSASENSLYLVTVGASVARYDHDKKGFESAVTSNAALAPIIGVNHTQHGVFVEDNSGSSYILDRETLQIIRKLPGGVCFSKDSGVFQELYFVHRKKGEGVLAPVVLAALNCVDWEIAWEFESKGSVAGFAVESGKLVQADMEGTLYCVDTVNGNLIWEQSVESLGVLSTEELLTRGGLMLTDTPRICGNTIILAYMYSYLIGVDLHTGELKWKFKFDSDIRYTTVTEDGVIHIYSPASNPYAAQMYTLTGEFGEIKSKLDIIVPEELKQRFNMVTFTDVTDTHFWCLSVGGLLSAVNLTSGEIDWHYDIDDDVTHNPFFISNNKLFAATRNKLSIFESE